MNLNQTFNHTLPGVPAPAPELTDELIGVILETEEEHLPELMYIERLRDGELDLRASRMAALNWITEVHTIFNFSPDCAYLAINYMDRFLSVYELPDITWGMQLLALACVSIAAKMEETDVPLSIDLQVGNCNYIFQGKTIQRMELLVLSTLKWRMLAVTPFKLLRCFLMKVMVDDDDNHDDSKKGFTPFANSVSSSQVILNLIMGGMELLEFKPSEIALAAALSIAWKTKSLPIQQSISFFTHEFDKVRVLKCFDLVNGSSSSSSFPAIHDPPLLQSQLQSPIDVLDSSTFLSCKTNIFQISPSKKRRKLNRPFEFEVVEP